MATAATYVEEMYMGFYAPPQITKYILCMTHAVFNAI